MWPLINYSCLKWRTEWSKCNIPCCARQVRATFAWCTRAKWCTSYANLRVTFAWCTRATQRASWLMRLIHAGSVRHIRESDANVARTCRARSAQQGMLLLDSSAAPGCPFITVYIPRPNHHAIPMSPWWETTWLLFMDEARAYEPCISMFTDFSYDQALDSSRDERAGFQVIFKLRCTSSRWPGRYYVPHGAANGCMGYSSYTQLPKTDQSGGAENLIPLQVVHWLPR
jgi:hypothetical protein